MLTTNFSVVVGNATHPKLFEYNHGNMTLDTPVLTASTSKWPMAMMIVGLVDDGTIKSLDDYAHSYVPWWSTDVANDAKATITLRQLLSFTSGFGSGSPGQENGTDTCMDNSTLYPGATYDSCARMIYDNTTLSGTPGSTFSYNSVHLQLAGAIATHASGLTIQEVITKYLITPYGM